MYLKFNLFLRAFNGHTTYIRFNNGIRRQQGKIGNQFKSAEGAALGTHCVGLLTSLT